jgi:hypothetical protein
MARLDICHDACGEEAFSQLVFAEPSATAKLDRTQREGSRAVKVMF